MPPRKSNRNFIIIFAVISVISLIYGVKNFDRAFADIAIDFKITRADALDHARDFLIGRHFELKDYTESAVFSSDTRGSWYLQQELGVERTAALAKDSIDIWYWSTRYFIPLQKLEYRVRIDATGQITGFSREVEEEAEGPRLAADAARPLAEAFITGPMGMSLEDWEHVETTSYDRPNRRDHTFEWELIGFKASDAPYRMQVEIQGAEVSSFHRYLKVPQEWRREFTKQRSQNDLFQNIANFLSFLLIIAIFVHFYRNIRGGQVPWKTALWLGGILAAAHFIMGMNSIPLTMQGYDTTNSYGAFIGLMILGSVMQGLWQGMLLILLVGGGEYLYRMDHPFKLSLMGIFTRRGIRTKEFLQATVVGYLMAGFHVGLVVLFYVIGYDLGVWAPHDIEYSNAVSTWMPWIYPLAISMGAALLEEFWFRLFGISFLKRFLKSTALAVIIPAFIWGFLHSSYPQMPGYVRGIEVGIIGIVAGIIMLRFGIWATLTWHFVIDAVFIGLFLFQSSNVYYWISGLIVCSGLAIPAIIAIVVYLKRRKFDEAEDLLNQAVEQPARWKQVVEKPVEKPTEIAAEKPVEKLEEPEDTDYIPLGFGVKRMAIILGIIGLILVLLPSPQKFGDDFSLKINRQQAIDIATTALTEKYDVNPNEYLISAVDYRNRHEAFPSMIQSQLTYIKQNGTLEDAERVFLSPEGVNSYNWTVSFKKELDPDYYWVSVNYSDGKTSISHIIADSTVGAELSLDSAQVIAAAAFADLETDTTVYHLIRETSKQHDDRKDHYFTWETKEPLLAEGYYRTYVQVQGDEVTSGYRFFKIPEEWKRQEEEKRIGWIALLALMVLLIIAGVIIGLITFGKRVAKKEIRWKSGIIAGVVTFFAMLLAWWNNWISIWYEYETSEPVANFISGNILNTAVLLLVTGLGIMVIVSLAETFVGKRNLKPLVSCKGVSKVQIVDGVVIFLGSVFVILGLEKIFSLLTYGAGMPFHTYSIEFPEHLSSSMPWFGDFCTAVIAGIAAASIYVIIYKILITGIKALWLRYLILAVLALSMGGAPFLNFGTATAGEIAWSFIKSLALIAIAWNIMKFWIGDRLWALILIVFSMKLLSPALIYAGWAGSPYNGQGWFLLFAAAIPLIAMLWGMVRAK